jgi:hypothetical protein
MKAQLLIVISILSYTYSVNGQSFHDEVQQAFNFTPHKLSSAQQQELFPKLDEFFEKVIADKDTYLPLLREELKRNDNNPYFYYDGGILLMEISSAPADLQLIADALVKCDLRDVPPKLYFQHIFRLSLKNADVIDAGLHIFDDATFQVFIEQHVLLLNQGECLKFILPRYESEKYVPKLIERYSQASSDTAKLSIIELLYYSRNCTADKFMEEKSHDPTESAKVQILIRKVVKLKAANSNNNTTKYATIRKEIRGSLIRVSDEALDELDELTHKLSANYSCN